MTDCRGRAQTRIFIHFFKNFTLDNQENLESLNSETTGTTETVETVKKAPETVLTAHDDRFLKTRHPACKPAGYLEW